MKKRQVDPWFPFWIDKWLFGSTRIELEPDERGVFIDLMSISKKDGGYVRANEGVPYLDTQLCGLLNITSELYQRTVKKCIKYKKTIKLKDGTLYMTSHDVYKLSDRHKRRVENEMAEKTASMAEKEASILEKNRIEQNRIEQNKGRRNPPPATIKKNSKINFNSNEGKWLNIKEKDKEIWKDAYPGCNIAQELKKMIAWLLGDWPRRKKINYKRFITGWLSRTQDKGGTKGTIDDSVDAWAKKREKEEKENDGNN